MVKEQTDEQDKFPEVPFTPVLGEKYRVEVLHKVVWIGSEPRRDAVEIAPGTLIMTVVPNPHIENGALWLATDEGVGGCFNALYRNYVDIEWITINPA